jgi:hypothetical protein
VVVMAKHNDFYYTDSILSEFRNAFFCVSLFYSSIFGFIISNSIESEKFDGLQFFNFAGFLLLMGFAFWMFWESCEHRFNGTYPRKAVCICIVAMSLSGLSLYISRVISDDTKLLIGLVLLCWAFLAMTIASVKSNKKKLHLIGKTEND